MKIVGCMAVLQGILLLIGEYLCVEIAWRCMEYNTLYIALGISFFCGGLMALMIGAKND